MKLLNTALTSLVTLSVIVVTGCATNEGKDFLQENNITVERVHTKQVYVRKVKVTETNDGILIYGEVRRFSSANVTVPGHVDIEILSSNGQSLLKSSMKYLRKNHKTRIGWFKLKSNITLENGSTIRVAHHSIKLPTDTTVIH